MKVKHKKILCVVAQYVDNRLWASPPTSLRNAWFKDFRTDFIKILKMEIYKDDDGDFVCCTFDP